MRGDAPSAVSRRATWRKTNTLQRCGSGFKPQCDLVSVDNRS